MNKKYYTEAERKEAERERKRRWRAKNKDYNKQYYQNNKEAQAEYMKQRYQDHKNEISEYHKQWYKDNRERVLEKRKEYREKNSSKLREYREKNKERIIERAKNYRQTLSGYSIQLWHSYVRNDKEQGRIGEELPEGYITVDDIKLMIQQPCIYNCGETNWRKMGIDRIDNNLPHIKSNCVASCTKCNIERGQKDYNEFLKSKCK